jgi:hypothetical protein
MREAANWGGFSWFNLTSDLVLNALNSTARY